MFNDFLTSIKGEIANQLSEKTELKPDGVNSASGVVAETLKEGIVEKAKQGQFDDIFSLFFCTLFFPFPTNHFFIFAPSNRNFK